MPTAVTMPLALVVCVLVAATAATPGATGRQPLQNPAAEEAALALDRPTRRLLQQGLRNEGFDPGMPDGLFGPRSRAAIRDWQQARGASPTGYLNSAEAELLPNGRGATPSSVRENSPLPQASPAVQPDSSSAAAPPASTTEADANPAPPVATEADPQNAAATNTEPTSRPAPSSANVQLPPDIMVDRHLVRAERLLADGDPTAAIEAMNEILALHEKHDVVLADDFDFQYARVAFAAGRTETAIASLNQYLLTAGRVGEFYRPALELLDSAEVRLREEERAARWPPGGVFRNCEVCPEMVVLPGGGLALGRYEVTVAEYRAFASATGDGAGGGCETFLPVPGQPRSTTGPCPVLDVGHAGPDVRAHLDALCGPPVALMAADRGPCRPRDVDLDALDVELPRGFGRGLERRDHRGRGPPRIPPGLEARKAGGVG